MDVLTQLLIDHQNDARIMTHLCLRSAHLQEKYLQKNSYRFKIARMSLNRHRAIVTEKIASLCRMYIEWKDQ